MLVGLRQSLSHPTIMSHSTVAVEARMSDYRRWYVPGGTYFFTAVTHMRRPILDGDLARKCLHEAIETVRIKRPMELAAFVLLPEHIHTVWTLLLWIRSCPVFGAATQRQRSGGTGPKTEIRTAVGGAGELQPYRDRIALFDLNRRVVAVDPVIARRIEQSVSAIMLGCC